VPLGGSTYFLSRLPGDLGTYLALTGQVMVAADLLSTNFAERALGDDIGINDLKGHLAAANKIIINKRLDNHHYVTESVSNIRERILDEKEKRERRSYLTKLYGIRSDDKVICEPDISARLEQRAKDLIYGPQDAEIREDIRNCEKLMKMWDHYAYINETVRQMMPGVSFGGHFSHFRGFDTIRRCFYPDDMEEIKELLRKDGSEFALDCLKAMEAASPLSLALTLRLLREARVRNFPEAMALELGVAINRATDSEFPMAMENCILSQTSVTGNIWKYVAPIPSLLVDEYFNIPNWIVPRTVNLLKDSFVPVREYYKKMPSIFMTWLNGDVTNSPAQNVNFDQTLNLYLEDLGYDIREAALSSENIRKDLRREYDIKRYKEEQINRLTELGTDKVLRNRYFKERKALLDKMFESEETYYKEIHKRIEHIFEQVIYSLTT